ncbi:unnamed protein product [Protopolystoma xenopodis]|uniref:Uncharacterized protein n=1 Tax=Protopolystoma xenopodis TaxID=117903 RepID=A0A3S5BDX5_9PLAT|nr:unnamed protein product [Protopolystoma xenopodis]
MVRPCSRNLLRANVPLTWYIHKRFAIIVSERLTMAPLTDAADYDAGEMFGNVPSQWSNAGNHEYYDIEHRTR